MPLPNLGELAVGVPHLAGGAGGPRRLKGGDDAAMVEAVEMADAPVVGEHLLELGDRPRTGGGAAGAPHRRPRGSLGAVRGAACLSATRRVCGRSGSHHFAVRGDLDAGTAAQTRAEDQGGGKGSGKEG